MILNDNDELTPNAIPKLMISTVDLVTNIRPICQVLTVEKLSMKTGPNRFKIILSDGIHCVEAVLAYKANWIATKLDFNDIVEIVGYNSVSTHTDNVIIIQDLVIKRSHLMIIGVPTPFDPTEEKEKKIEEKKYGCDNQTSPTPTATYVDQQHPIIDDWIVLTSGSVHGIMRDDPTLTITTSTVASFCCPNSLSIDFDSDFDSINDLNCVVTITGSCYQLGFKNVCYPWDDCLHLHTKNLNKLSNSPNNFRTRIVNVGDYASHVFTGTFVGEETHNGKDEMMVELDIDVEFGSGFVEGDGVVGLDSLTFTQSRNLYRILYPEIVPYRFGPHVTRERVALILFGQITEKGITEDREEYYRISFDDYFSYPIEVQFPTEEVSLMVDLFSKLQHATGDTRKAGSIGHMAECSPPISIGYMVEPVSPPLMDTPLKRPLFQNTTNTNDRSRQECHCKKIKV